MDKNILEFLGRALLNAARSQQQLEDMNKIIGQTIGADNPFMQTFLKAFGWQSPEKINGEDIVEFTQKSSEAYKEFFKVYLAMFDVVPKEEYLSLKKENEDLKAKLAILETNTDANKKIRDKDNYAPEQVIDNLTVIMKNQTQQFQELMKQLNQSYKKGTTTKKK
ncbi:MAG: hypothetical protein CVU52_06625 [Deltaproteobacteria bacterium HGW-Deltaproteobacteria-10]|nr:MAG: hypothetical protein CVU52_06625 [Deltaproteobacteria bacterium HGW-Deltaproteobacteria-10]